MRMHNQNSGPRDKMAPYHQLAASLFPTEEDAEVGFLQAVKDGNHVQVDEYLSRSRRSGAINVDVRDVISGNTPLIISARQGDVKTLQLLLKFGADVTLRNYDNKTACDVTGSRGIKQAVYDSVSRSGCTHRHLLQAAWQGNQSLVQKILSDSAVDINCQNSDGLSPLHLVVRDSADFEKMAPPARKNHNPIAVLKDLIHRRADVNLRDKDSKTPLHYIALSKSSFASQMCQILLNEGSSLDAADRQSFSPLHCAVKSGSLDVVQTLLKGGASVHARAYAGYSPLHVAAIRGDERICQALIQYGADTTMVDDTGNSPMELTKSKQLRAFLQKIWIDKTQRNVEQNLKPVRRPACLAPGGASPRTGALASSSFGSDGSENAPSPRQGEGSPTFSRQSSLRRDLSDLDKADLAEGQMWREVSQGKYNLPGSRESYRSLRGGGGLQTLPATKSTDRPLHSLRGGMKVWRSASFDLSPDQDRDNLSVISPLPRILRKGSTTPSEGHRNYSITQEGEERSTPRMSFDFLRRRKSQPPVSGRETPSTTAPTPEWGAIYDEHTFRGRSSSKTCLEDLEDVHSPLPNIIPLRTPSDTDRGTREERGGKMATIDEEMRQQESAKEWRQQPAQQKKPAPSKKPPVSSEVKLTSDGEEVSPSSSSDKDSLDRLISQPSSPDKSPAKTKPEVTSIKHVGGGQRKDIGSIARLRQVARDNALKREETTEGSKVQKVIEPRTKFDDKIVMNQQKNGTLATIPNSSNSNPVKPEATRRSIGTADVITMATNVNPKSILVKTNLFSVAVGQQVKSDVASVVAVPVAKDDINNSNNSDSNNNTSTKDTKPTRKLSDSVIAKLVGVGAPIAKDNPTRSRKLSTDSAMDYITENKEFYEKVVPVQGSKTQESKAALTPRTQPVARQQFKQRDVEASHVPVEAIVASEKSKAVTKIQVLPANGTVQEPRAEPRSTKSVKRESEQTDIAEKKKASGDISSSEHGARSKVSEESSARRSSTEAVTVETPRTRRVNRSVSVSHVTSQVGGDLTSHVGGAVTPGRGRSNSDSTAITVVKPKVGPSTDASIETTGKIVADAERQNEPVKNKVETVASDNVMKVEFHKETEKISSAKTSKTAIQDKRRTSSDVKSVFEVTASSVKVETRPKTSEPVTATEAKSDSAKRRDSETRRAPFVGESAKTLAKSVEGRTTSDGQDRARDASRTYSGTAERGQVLEIVLPGRERVTVAKAHFSADGQVAISSAGKERSPQSQRMTDRLKLSSRNYSIARSGSGNAEVRQNNDPRSSSRIFANRLENAVTYYSGERREERVEKAEEQVPLALLARQEDAPMDDGSRALAAMNARYEAAVVKVNIWREKSDQAMSKTKAPNGLETRPIQTPIVREMYSGYDSPWSKPAKPEPKRDNSRLTRAETNPSSLARYNAKTTKTGTRPKTQDNKKNKVETGKTVISKNKNLGTRNGKSIKKNPKKKKGKGKEDEEEEETYGITDRDPNTTALIGGIGWHVVADMDDGNGDVVAVGLTSNCDDRSSVAVATSEVRASPETSPGFPLISPSRDGARFFGAEPVAMDTQERPASQRFSRLQDEITPRSILPKIETQRGDFDENLNEIINEILTITSDNATLNDSITNTLLKRAEREQAAIFSPRTLSKDAALRSSWESDEGTIKPEDLPPQLQFETATLVDDPLALDLNFAAFDPNAIDPNAGGPGFIYAQLPPGFQALAQQCQSAPTGRQADRPPLSSRPPSAALDRRNSRGLSMSFKEVKDGKDIFRSRRDSEQASEHASWISEQLSYVESEHSVNEREEVQVLGAGQTSARWMSSRQSNGSSAETMSSAREETLEWKKGNMLGRGAYGTVWCGLMDGGGLVAVKQIEMNTNDHEKAATEYEKIQEEVDMLKTLKHTNIVSFYSTSLEEGVVSIFMEFVPGGSIALILQRFGALKEATFCFYTRQILQGVEYVHSKGVVHRDIKGANVMLTQDGIIKLIDFGCAKHTAIAGSMSESQNGRLLKSMRGTPYWMAPEVIRETGHGKPSDIWSIGCTVFEMATRKPPWAEMNRMAAIFAIGSDYPVPQLEGDEFSEEAVHFINQCLTRDTKVRPNATQLLKHPFIIKGTRRTRKRSSQSQNL